MPINLQYIADIFFLAAIIPSLSCSIITVLYHHLEKEIPYEIEERMSIFSYYSIASLIIFFLIKCYEIGFY